MTNNPRVSLLFNSRFYILAVTFLISVVVAAFLRLQIPSDQLFYIRTQQVYGLLCIAFWYVALIISPVGYIIGKKRVSHLEFARRAIGVSAAYFAVLHGSIALWGQLGGISELALLPSLFQWSLAGGSFALLILLIMAATSFDKVVSFMTYKRWKLLHRLVYIAWILVVLHIWTVGTHMAYTGVQWTVFIALVILIGLELYKVSDKLNRKYFKLGRTEAITLFASTWAICAALILMTPSVISNYHTQHNEHSESKEHNKQKAHDE